MNVLPPALAGGVVLATGLLVSSAHGQCTPEWLPALGHMPGTGGPVSALAEFDDGSGNALYAGGSFKTAGGVAAQGIARWDGQTWSNVGSGFTQLVSGSVFVSSSVSVLAVHDDGTGPALYAGGPFHQADGMPANHVARWDGTSWSPLGAGTNGPIHAMASWDDGSGLALYVAGEFTMAGGVPAQRIARWDGSQWSALGAGIDGAFLPRVFALAALGSGPGSALFAGGEFDMAGGAPAANIARWDGANWSSLGSGMTSATPGAARVGALAIFDDGNGPALYAGGAFDAAGGVPASYVARWSGGTWSPLGAGLSGPAGVSSLTVFDDGSGTPLLVAGGRFEAAGGLPVDRTAAWDGTQWLSLDGAAAPPQTLTHVFALATFDDGSGRSLFVGGSFSELGGAGLPNVGRHRAGAWVRLGDGVYGGVHRVRELDLGQGPQLYACGTFFDLGGVAVTGIARWDGAQWSPVPTNALYVWDVAVFDDGSGPALHAIGDFPVYIAKWNGTAWLPLGTGLNGNPSELLVFDDGTGSALYVTGNFEKAGSKNIAKWNGATWQSVGGGTNNAITAMEIFDDGTGPALFLAGTFTAAGGNPIKGLAKRQGQTWSAVPGAPTSGIRAMLACDDGSGYALNVVGNVAARYDGAAWTPLGTNPGGHADLALFDDGSGRGPTLYSVGTAVRRWDGTHWTALTPPLPGPGNASFTTCVVHDDGHGAALWATVPLPNVTGPSSFLGKWACPGPCGSIQSYGTSCAGAGGHAPTLAVTGCPASGGALTVRIEKAVGGAAALLLVGTQAAALPVGPCFLAVSPIVLTAGPLSLSGVGPGTGTGEAIVLLPPGLPTTTLRMSAACVDPTTAEGFTLTNGVAFTIEN